VSENRKDVVLAALKRVLAALPKHTEGSGLETPKRSIRPPRVTEIQYDSHLSWLVGALSDGSLCAPLTPFDRRLVQSDGIAAIPLPYLPSGTDVIPAMLIRPGSTEFRYFLWRAGKDSLTALPDNFDARGYVARKRAVLWMRRVCDQLTAMGHTPPDLAQIEDTMRSYAASLGYSEWEAEGLLVYMADRQRVFAQA
jgi:hypothetical protein